jgi:hypothetical protein
MRRETMGLVYLCCLIYDAFIGDDPELACIWTMCDVGFKTMLFLLHLNLGCNNYVELQFMWTICELVVTCDIYVESCTILVVCWWWFEILRDTWWTIRFIWAHVCACQHVSGDRHAHTDHLDSLNLVQVVAQMVGWCRRTQHAGGLAQGIVASVRWSYGASRACPRRAGAAVTQGEHGGCCGHARWCGGLILFRFHLHVYS